MCTEEASGLLRPRLLLLFFSGLGRSVPRTGGVGEEQEGGRTSQPCSHARTGQCQDHSKAGTGAQMLSWHAPFPWQSFTGFLSLDGVRGSLWRWAMAKPGPEV